MPNMNSTSNTSPEGSDNANLTTNSTGQTRKSTGFDVNFHPILITIAILIVLANGVVLLIFRSGLLLRRRSNYLLLSLTVSDMTTGIVALPLNIYCECTLMWKVCLFSFEANRFIAISTINHILVLTLEKYLAVMHPMRHRQIITRRNVTVTIATIWLLSLLVALIPLEWLLGLAGVRNRFSKTQEKKQTIHETFVFSVFFVLPLAIMSACYIRLLGVNAMHCFSRAARKIAKDSTPRHVSGYRRFKPMLMVLALLVIFILSWGWWFFGTIQRANWDKIPSIPVLVRSILIIMRYSSSFLNPLLYTLFRRDFKLLFKRFLHQCYSASPKVIHINMEIGFLHSRNRLPKIQRGNNQVSPTR